MKKVTMEDVAKLAGTSKTTVSHYINNRFEYMSSLTKLKIEEAIEELEYIPNQIAKSLKQKKTATIAVIVANILHVFSTEIIRAIEDLCEENNIQLFVCNAIDNPRKERTYIDMLLAKQVDGLIIFPTDGNANYYNDLKRSNFPVVFLDRRPKEVIYPTITLDNHQASHLSIDKMIKAKRKRIAIISTELELNVTPRLERIEGYKSALRKHNLEINKEWIIAKKKEEINHELQKIWFKPNKPDAFYAINDLALIELLKFLNSNKVRIPEDVSVIGFDDSPYLEIVTPPITTIKQPTFDMGRDAAKLLLELIAKRDFSSEYKVLRYEPKLINRNSV